MGEKYLMANGLRLAYDEFGKQSDPAIVLIMGLATQMIAWPPSFCEALAEQGYRVIRFDNRDIGLSQKIDTNNEVSLIKLMLRQKLGMTIDSPYTLRDMAADTIGLLDALDIKAAHWIGASMGGMIAQLLAAHYPERSLSLASIMSTTGNPELPQTSLKVVWQLMNRADRSNEKAYLKQSLKFWAIVGSPDYPPNTDELSERILASLHRSNSPKAYANHVAAIIESGDRRGILRRIGVPTLVIHGKADVLVPVEGGIDTADNIKESELKLVEGMGHDLPKELLPRFARWIVNNIERNETAAVA